MAATRSSATISSIVPSAKTRPKCSTVTRLGDLAHEVHVMLDGQDRHAVGIELLDDLARGVGLLRRHAGGRLVEQQKLGLQADRHADLQPLLEAVAEEARQLAGHRLRA